MEERVWLIVATFGYLLSAAWSAYALGARRPGRTWWNDALLGVSFALHFAFLFFVVNGSGTVLYPIH